MEFDRIVGIFYGLLFIVIGLVLYLECLMIFFCKEVKVYGIGWLIEGYF